MTGFDASTAIAMGTAALILLVLVVVTMKGEGGPRL